MPRERLISLRTPPTGSSGYAISPRVVSTARWIKPGQRVIVQGFKISCGNFYLQENPPDPEGALPGIIDAALPVSSSPRTSYWGHHYGYRHDRFISYARLRPEERYQYLSWLENGRPLEEGNADFLHLYLVGIERYVVLKLAQDSVLSDEAKTLQAELLRIGKAVTEWSDDIDDSVYAVVFKLAFLAWRHQELYAVPPWFDPQPRDHPSMIALVVAAQAAQARQPLSARWALQLVMDGQFYHTYPIQCIDEFSQIFVHLYEKTYPDGIVPTRPGTKYEVGSFLCSAYLAEHKAQFLIPDVRASRTLKHALCAIAEQCCEILFDYADHIRQGGSRESGVFLLPQLLWPEAARLLLHKLTIQTSEEVLHPGTYGQLVEAFSLGALPFGKRLARNLAEALGTVGLAFEPDVEDEEISLTQTQALVFFRAEDTVSWEDHAPDVAFRWLVRLLACLLTVEGRESVRNQEVACAVVNDIAETYEVDTTRLHALFIAAVLTPCSLRKFTRWLGQINARSKRLLATYLVQAVSVDNGPSAAESKCLAKVYKALGWDASRMYADLHAGKSTAPESDRQTGHQGTTLDADRLDELRAETRELRTTLGAIYAENMDRSVAYEVNPAREPAKGGPQQLALDAIHQKLVTRLLEKPLWARTEVAAISTSLHLLLDGALEAINESTLRLWDDILLEGADPIEVNPELVRRLS